MRRALGIAGVALAVLGPTTAARPLALAATCTRVVTKGAWTTIASPFDDPEISAYNRNIRSFESSPYSLYEGELLGGYAVDPDTPDRLLATDGIDIMRTTDGGCTWSRVYGVATPAGTGRGLSPSVHVADLVVAHTGLPAAKQRMYAYLVDASTFTAAGAATVATSADGGATWTASPIAGSSCTEGRLAVAPSRPTTVYVDCWGNSVDTLYASVDAGAHWATREAKGFKTLWQKGGFRVSPANPDELWSEAMTDDASYKTFWTVLRSGDGGRTWRTVVRDEKHTSFYNRGMRLLTDGRRTRALAWNGDGAFVVEPSGKTTYYGVPTPPGQAGPVEAVALDGSRLLFVAGYGVPTGDEAYPYGPSCGEGQRLLSLDLRTKRWTFHPAPPLDQPSFAFFDLQSVATRAGVDHYLRESGFRANECTTSQGSFSVGPRHSAIVRFRVPR